MIIEINSFDVTTTYKKGDKVDYQGSVWTFEPHKDVNQYTVGYDPSYMNYWIEASDPYGCNTSIGKQSDNSEARFFDPK